MFRLLVTLVVAFSCGGTTRPRPRAAEYIVAIELEGNTSIRAGELVPRLSLERARRGGRGIDPYQLQLDTQRIQAAYVRRGFFEVQVTSRIEGRGEQTVVFVVTEGRRAKARVELAGLPPEISTERARAIVGIREGDWFDYEVYDDAKERLRSAIEDAGYAHVVMDAKVVAEANGIGVVRLAFATGPRCRFGAVTISGADGDLEEAIVGRLAFAEGELYSPKALAKTQAAIYELGRFSTVRIDVTRTGEEVVPISIAVSAGTRRELKLGFGGGYEPLTVEARVRAGISYILADHPLWTLFADTRLAVTGTHDFDNFDVTNPEPKLRLLGTAQRLDVLRPRVTGEIGVGFDFVTVEAYTSVGPTVRLGLSTPIGTWLTLRAGWSLSYLWFTGVSSVLDATARAQYGLAAVQRAGSYQQTVVADLRDDPIQPTRGGYVALRIAEGTRLAGGALDYVQLTPELRGYYPLGPIVFAARLRAGAILGDVPVTERYFSGGQFQRGFSERALAPRVTAVVDGETRSVPIGGAALLEIGGELRIKIGELGGVPIGLTLFLDGADATEDTDVLDVANLHWATGLGVSVDAGGIKLRFEGGYRLNRRGPTEPGYDPEAWIPNTAFHFGVGDTF